MTRIEPRRRVRLAPRVSTLVAKEERGEEGERGEGRSYFHVRSQVRSEDFSPSIFKDFSPYYKHFSFETYLIQH